VTQSLSIFAATADQRYLLGSDIFLRTHFPMTMRSYAPNGQMLFITEDDLLKNIGEESDISPGNRVWVMYGAPGSGKSELIKWLETRLGQEYPIRSKLMVRISRHELDILSIINRFLNLLPNRFLHQTTEQRWAVARQKSRTVTKLVLLFALENLLDSDELINALFYRLLNALQPYVDRVLATEPNDTTGQACLELIGQETWASVLRETALPIPIEYEQFRHQLTTAFRSHLLEGLSLPDTMQQISQHCHQIGGQRPILLVDDLVQSLNIFATDLLDYLLTLEAGNWDVVLGLTPAAFEDNQRGRGLLQRITYLDTIDDRLGKVWLSDEAGKESYVLTEANCHEFAARYLTEANLAQAPGLPLFPFTRELLVRIYRALPPGKGKVRYFVRYLHQILERMAAGEDILQILVDYARPEYIARVEDGRLARLAEFYGPLRQQESDNVIVLPQELLMAFSIIALQAEIPVETLVRFYQPQTASDPMIEDEGQIAVRDWLLGKPVNRQMLKKLRQGAARWLRYVEPLDWLCRDHVAKPRGALRWRKTYLDIRPPICLEGVDEDQAGVLLTREIGMIAFDLCRYATAAGGMTKTLQTQFATTGQLVPFQLAASSYRLGLHRELEKQLGMRIELLALLLRAFCLVVRGEPEFRLPGFPDSFWEWAAKTHKLYRWQQEQIGEKTWQAFQFLFDDFFALRQAFYDGPLIEELVTTAGPYETWFGRLDQIEVHGIDRDYLLEGRPLASVLAQVQRYIQHCDQVKHATLSKQTSHLLGRLQANEDVPVTAFTPEVLAEMQMLVPDVYARLHVRLDSNQLQNLPNEEQLSIMRTV
jgi:hypothetical protein